MIYTIHQFTGLLFALWCHPGSWIETLAGDPIITQGWMQPWFLISQTGLTKRVSPRNGGNWLSEVEKSLRSEEEGIRVKKAKTQLYLFILVSGPQSTVLRTYLCVCTPKGIIFGGARGTIYSARDWTQLGCVEVKHPIHSPIVLPPPSATFFN